LKTIQATLNAWATARGQRPPTLAEALRKIGYIPKAGQQIPYHVIRKLDCIDEDPKRRLTLAQAIEQERINEVEAGELVRLGDVEAAMVESVVLPLRQWLVNLPTTYDVRCNQDNPATSRAALIQARDECMGLLRDKLPTIKSEA